MSEERVDGTVRDVTRFGEGVVATERGVVFADGVLPGERVTVSGLRRRGKVTRADRVRVVDASPQRVEPACSIVGRCGGCPLMIANLPLQAKLKRGFVTDALRGLPGIDDVSLRWMAPERMLGYRRRARLAFDVRGREKKIGFHAPRASRLVEVRTCATLDPTLDRVLGLAHRKLGPILEGEGELFLALGHEGRAVIGVASECAQPPELYRELEAWVKDGRVAGAALAVGGASLTSLGDSREVGEGLDGEPLFGPAMGFSQAHVEVNRALVAAVVRLAEPADKHVLELFSGSGNLTVALAAEAKALLAVESAPDAAEACRENLRRRGIDATVRTDDAESYRAPSKPDVAVLDPPRAGAPGAIRRLVKLGPAVVVYVSCDPPTLARDLADLTTAGYRLTDVEAFDMFPQTSHVEVVTRLER